MELKYTLPRGTFDVLPKDSYKWQFVEKRFREIAELFGYQEIITPIFEQADLFERSVGDSSDIVQKEMYKFTDRKGRVFALRPEGTASVVRSYVENNFGASTNLLKVYYWGPMFRYDRPQAGRTRQFSQYGIEAIGSNNPFVDAEVIAMFYTFLKSFGLTNFEVEINSIGCKNCSVVFNQVLVDYFQPHLPELCPDCQNRITKNPKRLLDCKIPGCKKIAAQAPSMLEYLDEECKVHFASVQDYLKMMEIPFKVNAKIVRGLDYYSQTAFEFVNHNLGAQNALGGGGRYNGLIGDIGGKDTAAIGFAGGVTRLLMSLEQEGLLPEYNKNPKIFLVALGAEAKTYCINFLSKLRFQGIYADIDVEKNSLKAQMKAADKSGAEYTLVMGEQELNDAKAKLKNMKTGEETEMLLNELIEFLQK